MNKLESIVVSNTEPNSKNVLWYDNKRLLIFSNGHWSPIVDLDDIDVDNLPNVSNLQEALKSLNIKVDNKVDKVTGKGLSTNDYTDEDKAKLTALPTSTQLTEKIDEAKLALFIDQWNAACGSSGKYNPANAPDAEHPFYLNHIWLTYREAMDVMTAGSRQSSTLMAAYANQEIRTHLPRVGFAQAASAESTFINCVFLEAVEMPNLKLQGYVFFNCKRLRSVNWQGVPIYDLNNTANANFQGCSKLVELRGSLRSNFGFNIADSPLLSLASFQYMVDNAYNTAPITITVHPDVYAKIQDETNTEWHALLAAGAAKQITFATTN